MEEETVGVEISEKTLKAAAHYADSGIHRFAEHNPPNSDTVVGSIFRFVEYDPESCALTFLFKIDWGGAVFRVVAPEGIMVSGNINGNGLEEVKIDYISPGSENSFRIIN